MTPGGLKIRTSGGHYWIETRGDGTCTGAAWWYVDARGMRGHEFVAHGPDERYRRGAVRAAIRAVRAAVRADHARAVAS